MTHNPISVIDVQNARTVVSSVVHATPLEISRSCSERAGTEIFLKHENLQLTGSFKIRGALNKIHSLNPDERRRGIVASSAGNHAQGVAHSARQFGVKATVVMPVTASLIKVSATKSYGAHVILKGDDYDQAYEHARELEKEHGHTFVHPYEDPKIIAGQGTVGLEVLESVPDLDSIIVPIGGGGLVSGVATVIKSLKPNCRVYGVQAAAAPSLAESFRQKKMVRIQAKLSTIADGLAVKTPSSIMFENYISKLIDDVAIVSEDEIADAIVFLMERTKSMVEGSGAISLAAAFSKRFDLGKKCCVILSGGNIDLNIVSKVIDRGLRRHGRLGRITVAVEDRPGMLSKIAQLIAKRRANILQVNHERGTEDLFLGETAIEFSLETNSWEHLEEIKNDLISAGCRPLRVAP